jgi:hypothetical protein
MRWFAAALQQIAGQASSHGLRPESKANVAFSRLLRDSAESGR